MQTTCLCSHHLPGVGRKVLFYRPQRGSDQTRNSVIIPELLFDSVCAILGDMMKALVILSFTLQAKLQGEVSSKGLNCNP